MNELAPTLGTSVPLQSAQPAQERMIASDFQTFLTMLTTQMRHQDPMNPMQASDFAVQLATFSGVEQQVQTNQLLGNLTARMGLAELGNWVGMEVRAPVPGWFDGSAPIRVAPGQYGGEAGNVLVVRNALGNEVDRLALDPGAETVLWGGIGTNGQQFPAGHYSFELHRFNEGELAQVSAAQVYAQVREAAVEADGVALVLVGGQRVAASQVSALRLPDMG